MIAIVRIFICVGTTAAALYDQTALISNQTESLTFAFISRERCKWAQSYSRDEKASSYSNSMAQSKVKVHKISQARDIS